MRILLCLASAFILAANAKAVTVLDGGRAAGLVRIAQPSFVPAASREAFASGPQSANAAPGQAMSLQRSNIASLGTAIGNVSVGDVPDRAFWALLVAGFAVGGFALRGRRTLTVAA